MQRDSSFIHLNVRFKCRRVYTRATYTQWLTHEKIETFMLLSSKIKAKEYIFPAFMENDIFTDTKL